MFCLTLYVFIFHSRQLLSPRTVYLFPLSSSTSLLPASAVQTTEVAAYVISSPSVAAFCVFSEYYVIYRAVETVSQIFGHNFVKC